MRILPIDPSANARPEALRDFLRQCAAGVTADRPRLVSISLKVDALDPLAVLESIFEPGEPHFFAERPDLATALAGAEEAMGMKAAGPGRFREVEKWIGQVLDDTIAVGEVAAPFGGPHFFASFAFADTVEAGEPFPAAQVFVPRWQVARAGGVTTAVANLVIRAGEEASLESEVERVFRAHAKFRRFEYRPVPPGENPEPAHPIALEGGGSPAAGEAAYRNAVTEALERIGKGEFGKIVLARALDLRASSPLHPLVMLNALRQRFPSCYAFSLANGKGQSFIGASPERLVRVSRGRLETEALAGSIARGQGASEDAALASELLVSEKDRREQRLVLDAVVGRLTALGLKPEYEAEPTIRRLANVQHLQTAVTATLPPEIGLLRVVEALHPTPAVGGWPSEAALAHIRGLEGFPRGLYAGALGWINSRGGGEFFVGLRSALVEGAAARLYAGAGIVAGSDPDKELAETDLKFRAMRDALGNREGGKG